MSSDRFITWLEKKPTRKTVEEHVREFLGTGFDFKWDEDRWFIGIPGNPAPWMGTIRGGLRSPFRRERFIEVIPMRRKSLGNLDVLTRQADPLVSAIADGLVRFLCFRLHGDSSD
jgi:hypothetical protein